MSIGAVLVGIAVAAVGVAYVGRPFWHGERAISDEIIEGWVSETRRERADSSKWANGVSLPGGASTETSQATTCPVCGELVPSGNEFCPTCGSDLERG